MRIILLLHADPFPKEKKKQLIHLAIEAPGKDWEFRDLLEKMKNRQKK